VQEAIENWHRASAGSLIEAICPLSWVVSTKQFFCPYLGWKNNFERYFRVANLGDDQILSRRG